MSRVVRPIQFDAKRKRVRNDRANKRRRAKEKEDGRLYAFMWHMIQMPYETEFAAGKMARAESSTPHYKALRAARRWPDDAWYTANDNSKG